VKCLLCERPDRAGLDSQLIAGVSFRDIARQFHTSKDAVFRHKQHVVATPATEAEFDALDVASVLRYVAREAARIGKMAEAAEDYSTALKATLSLRDGLQWLKTVPVELPAELTREEALERARALVERLESTG